MCKELGVKKNQKAKMTLAVISAMASVGRFIIELVR